MNTFVATFLGSPPMNLIDDMRENRAVKLGVRPEDVVVSTTPPIEGELWRYANVLVVEPMGNETLLTLDRGGQRIVARAPADVIASPGQRVWVRLPPNRTLTFDSGTGARQP